MAEELVNPERLKRAHRLIWIRFWRDAEGKRLQVEATVTERHLEVVAKGPKLIFSTEEVESPLVETFPVEKLASGEVLGVFDAEDRILEYVRTHTHANASLLAGEMTRNVRGFIEDEMPYLAAHFFYRSLDICSFREIYRRWKVAKTQKFECPIDELRFYKNEMVQKRGVEHHCYEKADRIIWIDCEMTGLELDTHHIVEIACIVTNADLQIVDHLDNIVIHQTPDAMRLMSDWCRKVFKKNGLTQRIIDSMITKEEAEARVLEFLSGTCLPACVLWPEIRSPRTGALSRRICRSWPSSWDLQTSTSPLWPISLRTQIRPARFASASPTAARIGRSTTSGSRSLLSNGWTP
ncbi:hypothetical protein L596_017882 [Steinernema carpocapsae]|uniref:Exonuclease domain-containing protein n=1 Tax=Steinernema carpocapsae TaxID=34508 RepID=A0A4U5N2Z4_STECR|nr:hypothetical protein L596_017882 [Steinernema carpocapsae]